MAHVVSWPCRGSSHCGYAMPLIGRASLIGATHAHPSTRTVASPLHPTPRALFDAQSQNRESSTTARDSAKMLRQDYNRIDPKRRNVIDHRKKQFATPQYRDAEYKTRLNFYSEPPTADITLEQFEQWAIDRLRGEWCSASATVQETVLISRSSRRTGSVLLSKQDACRDDHVHEAYSRQISSTRLYQLGIHEAVCPAPKGPL